MLKVLITGSNGFIGKNLKLFLKERKDIEIFCFNREHHISSLFEIVQKADFIFHLAGVNRSKNIEDFYEGNVGFTKALCDVVRKTERKIPIIYTSSIQADQESPYGSSKRKAEDQLLALNKDCEVPIHIFRLTNVFGKWSKPNYNSVVATFCNNIIREIPINIDDENNCIELIYIDDVIKKFIELIFNPESETKYKVYKTISPSYNITVGKLAEKLYAFKEININNTVQV